MIMDGNGRWARRKGWRRINGHEQGAQVVRAVTTSCARIGVRDLTLYAFSTENWSRPRREVQFLMHLLERYLADELPTLLEHGVSLHAIGSLERLPQSVRARLDTVIRESADGERMRLHLALSYGGREELTHACRRIAAAVAAGTLRADAIDEDTVASHLYTAGVPDVDLVIRTAGEQRLSNFLPWQSVYAEFVSVDEPWPEFGESAMLRAIAAYQRRERRFGCVAEGESE